jgi:hypothetical protein
MRRREMVVFTQIITRTISEDTAQQVFTLRVMNKLEGPPNLCRTFLTGGVDNGARALHVLNFIWFGYVASLSQWGGGGVISSFK